jgi:serine/threonine protein kinase
MFLEGIKLDRYQLSQRIGKGGMGEVYRSEDIHISREVALKIIEIEDGADVSSKVIDLFNREMRAIGMLNHPHILPLYDYGASNISNRHFVYMVTPYCQEKSLNVWRKKLYESQPLAPKLVKHFVQQAAAALQEAHDHNVIHRDVKPHNFLIRENKENPDFPDLLLADFGIAKFMTATPSTMGFRGTPIYMAPEQWNGNPLPASDQYALAIMTYELLTGGPPFHVDFQEPRYLQLMMQQHTDVQPEPPGTHNSSLPKAIDAVILRALAKKPEERYPSITAFAQDFHKAVLSEERGDDIHMVLAISEAEALYGTECLLTLPKGLVSPESDEKNVPVPVPSGTQNGHEIVLEGQGRSSEYGGPNGALKVTIAIKPNSSNERMIITEVQNLITDLQGKLNQQITDRLQKITELQQSIDNRLSNANNTIAPINKVAISTEVRKELQEISEFPAGIYQNFRSNYIVSISTLIVLIFSSIILIASLLFNIFGYMNTRTIINQSPINAIISRTPDLDDHLNTNQSGDKWDESGNCIFSGQGYYAVVLSTVVTCTADATNFNNFVYQVSMTIIAGDCGGMNLRSQGDNFKYYLFEACQDGTYRFSLYANGTSNKIDLIPFHHTSAIRTGLKQFNTIAVIANGSTFDLEINYQKIDNVDDTTFSQGYQLNTAVHDKPLFR